VYLQVHQLLDAQPISPPFALIKKLLNIQ